MRLILLMVPIFYSHRRYVLNRLTIERKHSLCLYFFRKKLFALVYIQVSMTMTLFIWRFISVVLWHRQPISH